MPAYVLECIIVWCQCWKHGFFLQWVSFHLFQKINININNVENIPTLLFTVVDFISIEIIWWPTTIFLVLKDKSVVAKNKLFTCTWIFVVQTYCPLALTCVYPCANSCGLVKPTSSFAMLGCMNCCWLGHSELASTTTAPWRMDGKWSGNNFPLGSSSLAKHGGLAQLLFFLLPTHNHNQVVSR
jgi:hypothetical protein